MSFALFFLAMGIALIDWIAVARGAHRVELFAKPGALLVLIIWLAFNNGLSLPLLWFWLGLVFSLAGDICLLPQVQRFLPGLTAFLFGLVCYVIGFNQSPPPFTLLALAVALLVLLTSAQIYRRVVAGLRAQRRASLTAPILAYALVISLMLFSAIVTLLRPDWRHTDSLLAAGGAALFYSSDAILSWNKFVAPIRHGRLINMITYHLGQFLIILAAALHYHSMLV
jgi:uncharacterized membrane protein YhhN